MSIGFGIGIDKLNESFISGGGSSTPQDSFISEDSLNYFTSEDGLNYFQQE